MKTLLLTIAAAVAALFFLPVDLDVQASVFFAAGLFALLSTDYARRPKILSAGADIVPFSTSSVTTALEQAA